MSNNVELFAKTMYNYCWFSISSHMEVGKKLNGYCTVDQFSEKWEISKRRVQKLCSEGRIHGAQKFGTSWAIPDDAEKPMDGRSDRKKESEG